MNNVKLLQDRITRAFASSMAKPDVASEIAFHMTDWDHDVDDLIKLYQQSETLTDDEILKTVIGFLVHVPNHVAAAKKLAGIGPIEDIFKVGVFEEDAEQCVSCWNRCLTHATGHASQLGRFPSDSLRAR